MLVNNSKRSLSSNHVSQGLKSKVIGHYSIGEKLGEGTFSKVCVGTHLPTGERVAIKILEKKQFADMSDKKRVEKEIGILKKIRHHNIISLYSIIESANKIYIITEYCPGGELFDHIVKRTKLSENEAIKIFSQLISGVEYLHRLKIVHRDLKPENLLFCHKKELKIADFGLSNVYSKGGFLYTACGSPCYAAPEMVKGMKYEPAPVDIWSCGIVLFTMVCGYLPFEDENQERLFTKIAKGTFNIPPYISPLCKDLLKNLLNVNPSNRFNFEQIKDHPWLKAGYNINRRIAVGIDLQIKRIPLDEDLVVTLNKSYNYSPEVTINDVLKNKHNDVTATYYLLLKRKIRNGECSVADIGPKSEAFKTFINSFVSDLDENIEEIVKRSINQYKFKHGIIPDVTNTIKQILLENIGPEKTNEKEQIKKIKSKSIVNSNKKLQTIETVSNVIPTISNVVSVIDTQTSVDTKNEINIIMNSPVGVKHNTLSAPNTANAKLAPPSGKKQWGKYKDIYVYKKTLKESQNVTPVQITSYKKLGSSKQLNEVKEVKEVSNFDTFEEKVETVSNNKHNENSGNKEDSREITQGKINTKPSTVVTKYDVINTEPNKISINNKIANPLANKIDMTLNLKTGAIKNFLESNKRDSIKEEYEKYTKKISLTTRENKEIIEKNKSSPIKSNSLINDSVPLPSDSTIPNEKEQINSTCLSKVDSDSLLPKFGENYTNNYLITEYDQNIESTKVKYLNTFSNRKSSIQRAPITKKIRFLNTSVVSVDEETKARNVSFDDKLNKPKEAKKNSVSLLHKNVFESFYPNGKKNFTFKTRNNEEIIKYLKTDIVNTEAKTERLTTDYHSPVTKRLKLDILNIKKPDRNKSTITQSSERQPTYANTQYTNNANIVRYGRPMIPFPSNRIVSKSPLDKSPRPLSKSPYIRHLDFNMNLNLTKFNKNLKIKSGRPASTTESKQTNNLDVFPGLCCQKNLNSIRSILELVFGKKEVVFNLSKSFITEVKCVYKANTEAEIKFQLSIVKLKESRDYNFIRVLSFTGKESNFSKVYEILKNKLVF